MRIKNVNFYYNIPSFKGKLPISIPVLKGLRNVRCVYCGQETLIHKQIQEFAKHASELKDRKLSRYLFSYETYMKDNEKQVLFFIHDAIEKFPNRDLKDIFQMMFPYHIKRLEAHQQRVLTNIGGLTKGFTYHDRDMTLNFVQKGLEEIKKSGGKKHFKKNEFLTEFYDLRNNFENPQSYLFVREKISAMPSTYTSTDAFIVKYSRKTNQEISSRLLTPSQSTLEHLDPKSEGGTNELSNLVIACGKDNSTRRSAPLDTMPQIRIHFWDFLKSAKASMIKGDYDIASIKEYFRGTRETIDKLLTGGFHIYKS